MYMCPVILVNVPFVPDCVVYEANYDQRLPVSWPLPMTMDNGREVPVYSYAST